MELFKLISSTDPTVFVEGQVINNAKSIMWVERYREPGEFEIVAPLSSGLREFLPIHSFVSHIETLEVMVVENHEISEENMEDPIITITGRSLEAYLQNRIVGMNQVRASSTISEYSLAANYTWNQIVTIINDHIGHTTNVNDNLVNVKAIENISGTGESELRTFKRVDLHKTVLELLAIDDLGIKSIRRNPFGATDSSSTETRLCVYKGLDKTTTVVFSWKAGEIEGADYLWSEKKLKNSAIIIGRYVNTVVDTAGATKYNRRTMVVTAEDIDGIYETAPTGATLTSVISKMQTRGRQALKSQVRVTIARADLAVLSKYQYRKDFNVGDLIRLDGNFGVISTMRVIEYVEIQDENGETGHPTLSLPGE